MRGLYGQLVENRPMSQMDAVEVADGGDATVMPGTKIVLTAYQFHNGQVRIGCEQRWAL
jgi:hypothetical protein